MPSSKTQKGSSRKEILTEKSSSFNGRSATMAAAARQLSRPNTLPNLKTHLDDNNNNKTRPQLTKLLLNVTVQGSVGALHILTTSDSIVGDLIGLALRQYVKEGRRPILPTIEPDRFGLHYSQFSLDRLDRTEKLINLGSRNFFLCRKPVDEEGEMETASSCSEQAEKIAKASGQPWLKFIDFLLWI